MSDHSMLLSGRCPDIASAVRRAAQWYACLNSGQASEADQAGWRSWRDAHPLHAQAWQQVERVSAQFGAVPGSIVTPTLSRAAGMRRSVLRSVAFTLGLGAVGAVAYRSGPWSGSADTIATATGERREIVLDDGSQLALNTRSEVRIAYTDTERALELLSGEIHVTTAPDPRAMMDGGRRPFLVRTRFGEVLALGTRFSVYDDGERIRVAVQEAAVQVRPASGHDLGLRVEQGRQLTFTRTQAGELAPAQASAESWREGKLEVVDMPLGTLIGELSRYRRGYLSCDPEIGHLKVSGAFLLDDTDRALSVLARSFPVRIVSRTRYWVRVAPR